MACVVGIARTFHPMVLVLERRNPYYSDALMSMATLIDYVGDGNAYWLKLRNSASGITDVSYMPRTLMELRWSPDGSDFFWHYEYSPNGFPEPWEVGDVVHFRRGIDTQNPR